MKNVAHYQSESQTMNTTTCLILITATLLAAAKGFEVGSFGNPHFYDENPAPTSKVILVSCENVVQLKIESAEAKLHWFLRINTTPYQANCKAEEWKIPVDRSMYRWHRASLPVEISTIGQQFVVITPEEFKEGERLWVGTQ